MNMKVDPQEVTWEMTITFWWAQMWRSIPLIVLASILAGALYHFITEALNVDPTVKIWMGVGLGFYVGLLMTLWVVRRLLTKGFGKYRLFMVEKEKVQDDA